MNRKRVICGIMAAVMLMPAYSASAAVKSKVSSTSGERIILGTSITGETYSNDPADIKDLTVDEAVEKAINYSRNLKNIDENIDIAEVNEKVTRYAWQATDDATSSVSYSISLRQLANSLKNYNSNKEVEKEKIVYNVTQIFYGLKDADRSIELYDEQIELSERQLEIYKVMLSVGKMSQVEYDEKVTECENLKASRLSIENSIDSTFRTLNQLMGENVSTKYNIIVDDMEFEAVSSELNVSSAVAKALATNQSLKELSDSVDIAKYTKDTYYYRGFTGETNSDKETIDSNYAQLSRSYEDAKKNLVVSINGLYDDIKDAESTYKQNASKLKDMQAQLAVKETQLSLGKTTQIEVDAYKLSVEQLEAEMESSVRSYDLLVRQFNNSDLVY